MSAQSTRQTAARTEAGQNQNSASTASRRSAAERRGGQWARLRGGVAENPFAAVAGAVAVSAGLALLLPSTRREAEVMGEVADKLAVVAREAADGVVATGQSQVETLAQTAIANVVGAAVGVVGGEDATGVAPR